MTAKMRLLLLLFCLGLLTACGGDDDVTPTAASAAAPTATPDPAAILADAGAAMSALQSAAFTMERQGGPTYMDENDTLNFVSASGDYAAPDSVSAVIAVQSSGTNLEISTIAIGAEQWITNPLNQRWEKLPPGWGFNPALLFDPDQGWQPLLSEDVSNARLIDTVTFGDASRYRIQATVAGDRVQVLTGGVVQAESLDFEIFIDVATRRIIQLSFATDSDGDEPAEWLLRFTEFDHDVTIEAPAEG